MLSKQLVVTKTRKELYDEIWKLSVASIAKKYDIPYNQLMQQIKAQDIPIPPSGYWTQLGHGKPVSVIELTGEIDEKVELYKTTRVPKIIKEKTDDSSIDTEEQGAIINDEDVQEPEIREFYGQKYNVYNRENLYKEVWKSPVTEVAKKYKVSDVAIHKVCKSLNIPTPPLGYWAKLRSGKPVTKLPLPKGNYPEQKEGMRPETAKYASTTAEKNILAFLSEEDRAVVLSIAQQILLPGPDERMHKQIIQHRNKVTEWHKPSKKNDPRNWRNNDTPKTPFFADTIDENSLPRVCRIFDALIKALEPLGCSITDNLDFIVNGEYIPINVTEIKDQVPHVITQEENLKLLEYEDNRRRYPSLYSKPNFRKYDYIYNGRVSFTVFNRTFRDCKSYVIEDKLGEIIIELYEASDIIRQQREAREEAERKRKEEAKREEERRKRYNLEIDNTHVLINAANDYKIACKIRSYVAAVEASSDLHGETCAWIEWAKQKADWYDPTIAHKDKLFGIRDHQKDTEDKKLRKYHSSWNW